MEKLYTWLKLKAVKGLGEKSIKKLYRHFKNPGLVFEADLKILEQLVGHTRAKNIKSKTFSFDPEKVVKVVEKEGIGWTTLDMKDYPKLLKEIEDPPPVLFYVGNLRDIPLVGVVGTRNPDIYSVSFTKEIVQGIVSLNFGVASGGAKGIDYLSHKFCVEAGGYTACFLGMGVLKAPEHLRKTVLKEGVLMSEFLPEEEPAEYTFVRRNRLISGSSLLLLIIEAGEKSGALITAEFAHRQGRPIFAHIGVGKSPRWKGCVKLVNEGIAKAFSDLSDLGLNLQSKRLPEDDLISLLVSPKTFEDLLTLTGMDPRSLMNKLTLYEIEGKIRRNGSYYTIA